MIYALLMGGIALLILIFVHPMLYLLCQMLPGLFLRGMVWVVSVLLCLDLAAILYTTRKRPFPEKMQSL